MAAQTTDWDPGVAGWAGDAATEPCCVHCGLVVPRSRRTGGRGARFCCFGCRLAYELAQPAGQATQIDSKTDHAGGAANTLLLRLGLGIFLAMNVMVFSWAFYSCEWYTQGTGRHDLLAGLFAYLLGLLTTILIAMLGVPLVADALGHVLGPASETIHGKPSAAAARPRNRFVNLLGWLRVAGRVRLDTNTLICMGVGAAYLISVIHTLQGRGSLYYDTAAMILVLVTLGYFLESTAKRKAMRMTASSTAPPAHRVRVRRNGEEIDIGSDRLLVGDRVYTRAGEGFVVDGVVVEGISHVNDSCLTGESKPREVGPGDAVLAGTINLDGPLWIQTQRVGDDRVIRQTQRLLEDARMRQLPIQRLVDRAASVFVPSVLVLAVGVVVWHTTQGQATRGLFDALSVLLISCPCALGLAAPLATWSTLRRAAQHGVIIDSAPTLERLAAIDRVFFDKTGTLTQAHLRLHRIVVADGVDQAQALQWAAALESTSTHPIARSLLQEAQQRVLEPTGIDSAKTLPGLGVEAQVAGRVMRLGSARLANQSGLSVAPFDKTHPTQHATGSPAAAAMKVYLIDTDRILARFDLAERLRDDAMQAVARLKAMGIGVEMLSGDQPEPTMQTAQALGMHGEGSLLPATKLERIADAQQRGDRVAMVGDGINDGPVLAGADVGFVMNSGTDLAKQAGHVWLLSDRLDRVPTTIAIARHCMKRVRLNLAWAFGYNLIGLTLAVGGMLTPIVSALAMIASSLMIVTTSRNAGRIDQTNDQGMAASTESENAPMATPLEPTGLGGQPRSMMKHGVLSQA